MLDVNQLPILGEQIARLNTRRGGSAACELPVEYRRPAKLPSGATIVVGLGFKSTVGTTLNRWQIDLGDRKSCDDATDLAHEISADLEPETIDENKPTLSLGVLEHDVPYTPASHQRVPASRQRKRKCDPALVVQSSARCGPWHRDSGRRTHQVLWAVAGGCRRSHRSSPSRSTREGQGTRRGFPRVAGCGVAVPVKNSIRPTVTERGHTFARRVGAGAIIPHDREP
jgi:hypothetical protein